MSLGTPQYMAPEQAMGDKSVDHRADIYALGAVTYEMLAGEPPFTGPNSQSIVAKVLTTDPTSLTVKRRSIPPHVSDAVLTALEKMPADRFSSAGEFGRALQGESAVVAAHPARTLAGRADTSAPWHARLRDPITATLLAAVLVASALAAWGWLRPKPDTAAPVVRFTVPVSRPSGEMGARYAFSPDGRALAYAEATPAGSGVRIRRLDRTESALVPNTEGAVAEAFSPDGEKLAFITRTRELKVLSLSGGAPVTIARNVDGDSGVDWSRDGYLYFISNDSVVVSRVDAGGGAVEHVGTLDASELPLGFTLHRYPRATPDGRAVLFSIYRGPGREGDIGVVDLKSRTTKLIAKGVQVLGVRWGHLLYLTADGTLWAARFDERRLVTTGTPVALVPGIQFDDQVGLAIVAEDGTLAYAPAVPAASELVWLTRDGAETGLNPSLRMSFDAVAISPDGGRVAVSAIETDGTGAIWIYQLAQQTLSRFTQDGALNFRPVWTPDGSSIVYASDRGNETRARALWMRKADASDTAHLVVRSPRHAQEITWPNAGDLVVYREGYDDAGAFRDIRYLQLGGDTTTHPFLATRADELNPALSPDGRWLAYVSNQTGRDEVYVTPFPGPGPRVQLSNSGGTGPKWGHSGRELFYRASDGQLMAMDVVTTPSLAIARRRALFQTDSYRFDRQHPSYDVSPDDQRFLFIKTPPSVGLEVVSNWATEVLPRLRGRSSR